MTETPALPAWLIRGPVKLSEVPPKSELVREVAPIKDGVKDMIAPTMTRRQLIDEAQRMARLAASQRSGRA